MPRKSAASLAIVAVDGARPRLTPPEGMSKDARKVFIELVAANPPQHFTQSDAPLLRQYVEMICQAEQAARAIEREGAVLPKRPRQPVARHTAWRPSLDGRPCKSLAAMSGRAQRCRDRGSRGAALCAVFLRRAGQRSRTMTRFQRAAPRRVIVPLRFATHCLKSPDDLER
jgi:hypothetical protein